MGVAGTSASNAVGRASARTARPDVIVVGAVATRNRLSADGSFSTHNTAGSDTAAACFGAGLCRHRQKRTACTLCADGMSVCPHGRTTFACKPCGGKGLCPHGRKVHDCRDCGGAFRCRHGRIRAACGRCRRGECPHGSARYQCRRCFGGGICSHDKLSAKCIVCVGQPAVANAEMT